MAWYVKTFYNFGVLFKVKNLKLKLVNASTMHTVFSNLAVAEVASNQLIMMSLCSFLKYEERRLWARTHTWKGEYGSCTGNCCKSVNPQPTSSQVKEVHWAVEKDKHVRMAFRSLKVIVIYIWKLCIPKTKPIGNNTKLERMLPAPRCTNGSISHRCIIWRGIALSWAKR